MRHEWRAPVEGARVACERVRVEFVEQQGELILTVRPGGPVIDLLKQHDVGLDLRDDLRNLGQSLVDLLRRRSLVRSGLVE